MPNEDRDWLDERITVANYIPDDGFTAKVVGLLPKKRARAVRLFRWRILFVAAFIAACLLVVQMVSLAQGLTYFVSSYSPVEAVGKFAAMVEQPQVIYGAAGGVILLGFASIPFLRRWA